MKTPFFGPAYVSRSLNLSDNELINLYPEVVESKQGKEVGALFTTPGIDLEFTLGVGPIRALFEDGGGNTYRGAAYAVSGTNFYTIGTDLVTALRGSVAAMPGAYSYEISTGVLAPIALPFTPATTIFVDNVTLVSNGVQVGIFLGITATQQDGYVLIGEPDTNKIWQSNLLDVRTFDALNFAEASGNPDNIIVVRQIHREIFVLKENHTEVWIFAGTAGFAFARLDGVYIEQGLWAAGSVAQVGETLCWLTRNTQGECAVVQCTGFQPQRISTHAIEKTIEGFPDKGHDCQAYAYEQEGHVFYVMNFTTGDQTWVWDQTSTRLSGVPMWHRRDWLDSDGGSHRHYGNCFMPFASKLLIGNYTDGRIFSFNLDHATDDGLVRRWLRSWRALPQPVFVPTRFNSLQIDMQTGLNLPDAADPHVSITWSDDGGRRWANGRIRPAGRLGETARRVITRRLGSTKRNTGLDRIFRVQSSDALPTCLIGADLT